jgi:signal transduction histidine kinase
VVVSSATSVSGGLQLGGGATPGARLAQLLYATLAIALAAASHVSLAAMYGEIRAGAVHVQARFRSVIVTFLSAITSSCASCSSTDLAGVPRLAQRFTLFYNVVVLLLPWLLGAATRTLLERQRFAERVRIARELHDVVAHCVSVIGAQTAGSAGEADDLAPSPGSTSSKPSSPRWPKRN